MTNSELKKFAKQNGIFQYQIAEYLGMAESKLSAMYRKPADEEMQRAIVNAVNELKKRHDAQLLLIQAQKETEMMKAQTFAELFNSIRAEKPYRDPEEVLDDTTAF